MVKTEIAVIITAAAALIASATTYLLFRRKMDWVLEKISSMSVSVADFRIESLNHGNNIEAADRRLDRIEKELGEIPVEELKSTVKKENLFFEGLQNIIDFNPESVASLNKEAIHSER